MVEQQLAEVTDGGAYGSRRRSGGVAGRRRGRHATVLIVQRLDPRRHAAMTDACEHGPGIDSHDAVVLVDVERAERGLSLCSYDPALL